MSVKLDFETQLHCIPIRNEKANILNPGDDSESLIAEVQLRYQGLIKLVAAVFGSRKSRRYVLEGLSRDLYEKLDGKITVEDLVLDLAENEKLGFLEARSLIVQYLKNLMERGLVVIVNEKDRN